jgi:peroxin-19
MDFDDILNEALEKVTEDEDDARPAPSSKSKSLLEKPEDASDNKKNDVKTALSTAAATTAKVQVENAQIAASNEPPAGEDDISNLLKMLNGGDGDFAKVLEEAFKDLDMNNLMSKLGNSGAGAGAAGEEGGDENAEMEKIMKMLLSPGGAGGAEGSVADGSNPGAMLDPKVLEELASKLETSLGSDKMDKMVENFMSSIMSKDLMYEPIKAITAEYPKVLSKKGIPAADRSRYESQYSAYSALRKVFEQEGNNQEKVIQIMQDVERFGPPPPEISKILSAGGGAAGAGLGGAGGPPPCPTQ